MVGWILLRTLVQLEHLAVLKRVRTLIYEKHLPRLAFSVVLSFLVHFPLVLCNTGEKTYMLHLKLAFDEQLEISGYDPEYNQEAKYLGFRSCRLRFPLMPSPMPCSSKRDTKMFDSLKTKRA